MKTIILKIIRIYRNGGLICLIQKSKNYISNKIYITRQKIACFLRGYFRFQGKKYRYFFHTYNRTWQNERVVEIPIIWDVVKKYKDKKVLEIGNVLSHYFPVKHNIVDKYEKAEGVINEDVVNFRPSKKYDLIVSISTLEHVGWDEKPRDPEKTLRAVKHLEELLLPGGKLVVTLPLGYNSKLDDFLNKGKLKFNKQYYLKRITKDNKWIETNWSEVKNIKYGIQFPYANGIIIGVVKKY